MKGHTFSSFLDVARKEVPPCGTKFNARDESRSLMPVDGTTRAIKSRFIHRFPLRSSSEISHPLTSLPFQQCHVEAYFS
jgi:hypothetical protein